MDGNRSSWQQPEINTSKPFVPKDPEAFTRNMAHVIEHLGKAAAAWVEPLEKGEVVDEGPVGVNQLVSTLGKLADYWMSEPSRMLEAQTSLMTGYLDVWSHAVRRLSGEIEATKPDSATSDKRFADPEWHENILYDTLRQAYLTTSKWADELVEKAEDLDPHTKHKASFYVRQITHALSPSNFILTNPELYRETVESNGANLVRGMKMFAEDMAAGRGQLRMRQSDPTRFVVGRDMALSPGKVVAQNEVCQILQYAPSTETVLKRPLLICPPWINKFYILDLNPQKSFIRWAVAEGHTVFVISWVNPDESHAAKDWRDYIHEGVFFALDTIEESTGERQVNVAGYCVGGTLLSAAMAYLATIGDDRIASATLLTTQVDFTHAGDLKVFVDEEQLASLADSMKTKGYLDGSRMATAFNMLRAGDMIWPYFVNNYLKGKEPMPFDLLYWNSDSTRMPRANHLFYLRNCYLENRLATGRMEIDGVALDLSKVDIPIYNLATKEDHIAPALSVYTGSLLLGPNVTFVLTGSGHISGVVNPPDKGKYQYWTGQKPSPDRSYKDWLQGAEETPGSWWPHWQAWIEPLSGERVPAREPGGGKLTPIEDAPGSYVTVRC
ncbi:MULTISPECIES: class I poly(R)-hydroxyalkanoic acid synthase [unclassified Aureimonas]|uniref:class I poly(R)-hydroxyalkanoic acid synthase n=1 Tax=unclassified Aureimonas TaxID=2615206 RepID=UPI0006F6FAB0|nr:MULTISPECIES: class I poly(R)-hydroxyalkanoic acid synthase [unclassified Aureimonas]KQT57458.1 poly(3-hydroxyalkanoate) synthetase [Aureimonas sp. Leaf427]KQT77137.1 poly(3-hydroxyalkanoate) synthetase [Aureimonas sp. Leaf460]